jgi:ClpP class serine protease
VQAAAINCRDQNNDVPSRVAGLPFNRPLLLLPDTATAIASNLASRFGVEPMVEPEANAFRGKPSSSNLENGTKAKYRADNGIAIIPVTGELVNRGAFMEAESGLTSYEKLGATLGAVAADPNIRGILLDIDSTGGEAASAMEMGALVRQISSTKQVIAFVNGYAA